MIENTILSQLVYDEEYARTVIPHLKDEYFHDRAQKVVFNMIMEYFMKYNTRPSFDVLEIKFAETDLDEATYKEAEECLKDASKQRDVDHGWLIDETEKFCQDRAIYNAIMDGIMIIDGKKKDMDRGYLPKLLQDALGVSFETHIGHDFIEQVQERYEFYHKKEQRLPFKLEIFNKITRGGLPKKTLNVILAGTGVGKTLIMCDMAAHNLMDGRNVLYITNEMAEERIAERIDSNLMQVPINQISDLPAKSFARKMKEIADKTSGKLIIKEYPTAGAGAGHFRHLLNELKMKKAFIPDIIYIDYLNICCSSRIKMSANVNSYTYVKAIAEELRGLAIEFNVPIVSATQTNRSGFVNSDPGLEDTSESFGLPQTTDFMIAAVTSEELDESGLIMFKILKNRYNDLNYYRRFVTGIDRSTMTLFDNDHEYETSGRKKEKVDHGDDTPLMDKTEFGKKFDMSNFEDFK